MRLTRLLGLLLVVILLAACQTLATSPTNGSDEPRIVTLATHDSFSISEEAINAFESEYNANLQVLTLGDAGEALNKIILSKDAPLADLFYGVDNTFFSRAIDSGVFAPYESPALDEIPQELRLDPDSRLTPVDYGFVNINADKLWFADAGIPIPETLEQLVEPEYKNLLVVQNPATSSPGLAFLLTTIAHFGGESYMD